MTWSSWENKSDSLRHLRLALPANLLCHKLQQVGYIQLQRVRQALQDFRGRIFLPAFDLPDINFGEARLITQLLYRHIASLAFSPDDPAQDFLQICHIRYSFLCLWHSNIVNMLIACFITCYYRLSACYIQEEKAV